MSNNDSFIDEVTEEVRRDRLYAFFRRWGLVIALGVVAIVGGAAINEWWKARETARAQAAGDAILLALAAEDAEARAEALADLDAEGSDERRALLHFYNAAAAVESGRMPEALATLDVLSTDAAVPEIYRELATLKWAISASGSVPPEDRIARLSGLTLAGGAWRLLALEQVALAQIESGDETAARETLLNILADQEVTPDLRTRAERLMVTLGDTGADD